jgi:hypothetical protein
LQRGDFLCSQPRASSCREGCRERRLWALPRQSRPAGRSSLPHRPAGVTERRLGKLENGQRVSPSTLGMVENRLGWAWVRADGYWQAGNLTWGRRTLGMPSTKTRRYGCHEHSRACPPTWFAASSPSPGTGGRATTAQTSRPGGALDRRLPGPVALPRRLPWSRMRREAICSPELMRRTGRSDAAQVATLATGLPPRTADLA